MLQHIYFGMIGWPQVLLIVGIVLLLFGGRKIPELMKGLGQGVREFKDGMNADDKSEDKKSEDKKE